MNAKQAKLIRKYAGTMKYDADYLKKEFKALDSVTKGRMTGQIKHTMANLARARTKAAKPA